MSESIFAQLPRFDEGGAHAAVTLHGGEPVSEPDEPETPPGPSEAELELSRTTQALKETIASLDALKAQVIEESAQHTARQVSALASALFPKLAEAFLAEEITRHLPGLLPGAAATVQVRAEPGLAGQIDEIVASAGPQHVRIEVIEDEAAGPNRASVSWQDGGVDFDFASLLDACLAKLDAA